MKNNKNQPITIKTIFKWLKSTKGRKYTFAIFYIFFFIFIFILLSFNPKSTEKNNQPQTETTTLPFITANLETDNYTFTYQIIKNNQEKSYLGQKETNQITIQNDTTTYTYKYQNGILQNNQNTTEYYQLFDIYELKKLIKNSKYNYKQEYNDGKKIYSYLADNTLTNLLNIEATNQNTYQNEILIETNLKNEIEKITIDLQNTINQTTDQPITQYKIIITYGDL